MSEDKNNVNYTYYSLIIMRISCLEAILKLHYLFIFKYKIEEIETVKCQVRYVQVH